MNTLLFFIDVKIDMRLPFMADVNSYNIFSYFVTVLNNTNAKFVYHQQSMENINNM